MKSLILSRGIIFYLFIFAFSLTIQTWAEDYPKPQCPPKKTDNAFLPCKDKFLAPQAVGSPLVPYTGQELPSDGPLLDLYSGKWAINSKDGLLETTFDLVSGTPDKPMLVGSKPYKLITYPGPSRLGGVVSSYNSLFPNQTLVVEPGDTIRLHINDKRLPLAELQDQSQSYDPTDPVPINSNIHFHGMLVSPTGTGDNVYRTFLPGGKYISEINIPKNHDQGVNWYHPHFHRSTTAQVYGGLAGILQVGNVVGTDKRSVFGGLEQKLFVLNGFNLAESEKNPGMFVLGPTAIGTSPHFSNPNPLAAQGGSNPAPKYAPMYMINGQVNPIVEMRPGETQVWTMASVNPYSAYSLAVLKFNDDGSIDPEGPLFKSTMIAQDGNDHFTPAYTYFIKQRDMNKDTYVAPGQRLTWAVTAPEEPGDYYLVNVVDSTYTNQVSNLPALATFEPPSSYIPSVILATVRVSGEPDTRPIPEVEGTEIPSDYTDEPAFTRNISYDFDEHNFRGRINFGNFPDVAMAQSYSGDSERWVISTFSQVSHPFHIHQGQFVIEKIEYYEDQGLTQLRTDLPQNPVINDVPRDIDTFAFPGRSKTYIRLKASDYVGKFVMHCHVLLHEDSGMMVTVKVEPPRGASIFASGASSGKAPEVVITRATDGVTTGSFMAYDNDYTGGVDADAGQLTGVTHLGVTEYKAHIVSSKKSGSPLIRVFDYQDNNKQVLEFAPFGGKGDGATVAIGDIDGDSVGEIVVGSGKGISPKVEVYKLIESEDGSLKEKLVFETPVLDKSYTNSGVNIASGDVDGDNWDDIVFSHGPGAKNRIVVLSGQLISIGEKSEDFTVVDTAEIVPGSQGLNIAADNLAGGYFQYPPVTEVGKNPPAPNPYRALIAVTPSVESEDPAVKMYYYKGGGGHSHGPYAEHGVLRLAGEFTPLPGGKSQIAGLDIETVQTLVAKDNNPLIGLVSSNGTDDQKISYFNIEGDIETEDWALTEK